MKKYLVLLAFLLIPTVSLAFLLIPTVSKAEVPSGVMGFMDGKLYTKEGFTTGVPDYICFLDNNCYNKEMQWVFMREVQSAIIDLQNKVSDLQNQVNNQKSVAGLSSVTTVDSVTANRVKGEIQSYINGLNSEIEVINNSYIPVYGVFWKEKPTIYEEPYQIMTLWENYPGTVRIPFKDVSKFSQLSNPSGLRNEAGTFIIKSQNQVQELKSKINRVNIILFAIDDYIRTGEMIAAPDRAYLKTLGINW